MRADMVEAYVRDLLEKMTCYRPVPDQDGDLPVRLQDSAFYVRVETGREPYVRVFSVAVADVESAPELLHELNDINRNLRFARIFHVAGQVLVETEIWGDQVNPASIDYACHNVAWATDRFGTRLVERFGGQPHFARSRAADVGSLSGSGLYL